MPARFLRVLVAAAAFAVPLPVHSSACHLLLAGPVGPVGMGSCPGVRPGAKYTREDGVDCSMGFVFRGSDRRYYVSSAGHCIPGYEVNNLSPPIGREQKWGPGRGSPVTDNIGEPFGRFAYAVWTDDRDFSLIRLDAAVKPEAGMCYFGGPTSIYTGHSSSYMFFKHFGHGFVFGDTIPARTGFAPDTLDPLWVYSYAATAPGDSGSGAITTDGQALGTIVRIDLVTGQTGITRIDASVAEAEKFMGVKLTLQTAKVEPDLIRL